MSKILVGAAVLAALAIIPQVQAESVAAGGSASWTGLYVGAGIGRTWADTDWTTTCFGTPCTTGGVNPASVDSSSPRTFSTEGFRKSVYAGFNWQLDHCLSVLRAIWGLAINYVSHRAFQAAQQIALVFRPLQTTSTAHPSRCSATAASGAARAFWSSQACSSTARLVWPTRGWRPT